MSNELIRPIDAETAAAIEASAKLGTSLVEAAAGAGTYADRVLQRVPDNLVGLLIGDWLTHKRVRRWAQMQEQTEKILISRRVQKPYQEISPNLAIPLIEAAIDEDRDGIRDLWEELLASAYDPKLKQIVRPSLVSLLKLLDPSDAAILIHVHRLWNSRLPRVIDYNEAIIQIHKGTKIPLMEVEVSIDHLVELKCFTINVARAFYPMTTPIARLLLQAVARE